MLYEFSEVFEHNTEEKLTGACWYHLFRNPIIAKGYPIPARESGERGLEISISIMAVLGNASWAIRFDRTLFLKGFSSLFAPMKRIGSSILWHFMTHADGKRMSYNEGLSLGPITDIFDPSLLEAGRHFVGWTPSANIFTGKSISQGEWPSQYFKG